MDNIFLYLLGFAGTGKLTIARAFARSVGAKVVDNHWIITRFSASSIRTVCRLCRMRSGARPPRSARPCSKRSRRWQSLARTSYSRTMASKVSATTRTCGEASNQQRHAAAPGPSPSVWCAARMNLYVVSNRPIARPCSNAPIPPMRSTKSPPRRARSKVARDFDARRDEFDARAKRRGNCRAHQKSWKLSRSKVRRWLSCARHGGGTP